METTSESMETSAPKFRFVWEFSVKGPVVRLVEEDIYGSLDTDHNEHCEPDNDRDAI